MRPRSWSRSYHLMALPTTVARSRVLANWILNATAGDDYVRTGFLARQTATLRAFERTDTYLSAEEVRTHLAEVGAPTGS